MTLNSKQATANAIPNIARVSKMMTSSSLKVFMMLVGVPSGGMPSIKFNNYYRRMCSTIIQLR